MDIQIQDPTVTTDRMVTMTQAAANVVRDLLQEKNIPNHLLRIFVAGGGCSGMQYGMAFEAQPRAGDAVEEPFEGVRLLIDPTSAAYLTGAEIDYVDSLMGGGFRIENPNAVTTCGCGHSFRTAGTQSAASASRGGCGACS
ncbi:MAG: iron-sulfur cluster insertion protein ErpA [Ardenticatenaceae bacterium]